MSKNLDFFTPVVFTKDRSIGQFLLEKVDGYFSLRGERAFVINGKTYTYEVRLKNYDQSKYSQVVFGALKIASYFTLVLPFLVFIAKLILRSNYSFQIVTTKTLLNPNKIPHKPIFVFGDIHGELDGFKENLQEAGIIDSNGDWKENCSVVAIQMGDVFDRGPKSREAWQYLECLQRQARLHGGQLIRLLGNHEALILQRFYHFAIQSGLSLEECKKSRDQILKDIRSGKVQLAWTNGVRLFHHAGMRSFIAKGLIDEIKATRKGIFSIMRRTFSLGVNNEEITYHDLVNHINNLLKDAIRRDDFSHPIFQIGKNRGGYFPIGGILWEDISGIMKSDRARDIPQVVAHNPPTSFLDSLIRITPSQRLINVDAGLCKNYGGNNGFVHFQKNKIFIHQKRRSLWNLFLWKDWMIKEISDLISSV